MLTSKYISCVVLPGQLMLVSSISDIESAFKHLRRRDINFLPVAVFECDPFKFEIKFGHPVPSKVPLSECTFLSRAPICQVAFKPVFSQLSRLGDRAVPLFNDWLSAVRAN